MQAVNRTDKLKSPALISPLLIKAAETLLQLDLKNMD